MGIAVFFGAKQGSGATTSDAFDSPQPREDYRDVFEKCAPLQSSPPACRRRSGPRSDGLRPAGVAATSSSPTQMPTAEAPENKEGVFRPTMFSEGRVPPAPHLSTAYSRYGGVAAFGSGRGPDKLGGYLCWRARTFGRRAVAGNVQAVYGCLYPRSLSDACSNTAYCDACTIGKCAFFICRTLFILRHDISSKSSWLSSHPFSK